MDLDTTLRLCEDMSRQFDIAFVLEQAAYYPASPITNLAVGATTDPQWANVVQAQGNDFLSVHANLVPNQNGSFSLGLRMTDALADDPDIFLTLNIVIDSVNDGPTAANPSIALGSASSYAIQEADFGFADPNDSPPDVFKSVTITSLPSTGQLLLNGTPLASGAEIGVAAIRAGELIYTQAAPGDATSFGFRLRDSGGTEGCDGTDMSDAHTFALASDVVVVPPPPPPPPEPLPPSPPPVPSVQPPEALPAPTPVPFMSDVSLAIVGVALVAMAKQRRKRR